MDSKIISFHLGASSFFAASVLLSGAIEQQITELEEAGSRSMLYHDVVDRLVKAFCGFSGAEHCSAVVITTPAPVDRRAGLIRIAPKRPDLHQRPLAADFEARLKSIGLSLPVLIENDANAAGLCSLMYGVGRDAGDHIHIRVSTGIGSSLFIRGELYEGPRSLAGEIGHIPLKPIGWLCGCGNIGCAETVIGGAAFARLLRLENSNDPALSSHFSKSLHSDSPLSDACRKVLLDMGCHLGLVVATAVNILGPQCVVLSGPMFDRGGVLLDSARLEAGERIVSGLGCDLRLDNISGATGHAKTALAVYDFWRRRRDK